jgi:predicted transcriptional regulator
MAGKQYLFLPIEPEWAIAILRGTKKWELRTKRPAIASGDVVVVYASAPLKAVVGHFTVGEIFSGTPRAIWSIVGGEVASTRRAYFRRFAASPMVHAIQVKRPRRVDPYTPRFRVGQGWRFLDGRVDPQHRSIIDRINKGQKSRT